MGDGEYKVNLELINYEWFQDLITLVCNKSCEDQVPDVREIKQNLSELGDRTRDKTIKVAVLRSAMKITKKTLKNPKVAKLGLGQGAPEMQTYFDQIN